MPIRRINTDMPYNPAPCMDCEHNPPSMLYIPPGEVWEHVCPSCGKRTIMRGTST